MEKSLLRASFSFSIILFVMHVRQQLDRNNDAIFIYCAALLVDVRNYKKTFEKFDQIKVNKNGIRYIRFVIQFLLINRQILNYFLLMDVLRQIPKAIKIHNISLLAMEMKVSSEHTYNMCQFYLQNLLWIKPMLF